MKVGRSRLKSIAVLATATVVATVALAYWITLSPNTPQFEGERAVFIPRMSSFDTVADSMKSAGVLQNRLSFVLFGTASGWRRHVKAGRYAFSEGASNRALMNVLRQGLQDPVRVVIPPGSTIEVVAAVVAREMAFEPDEFLQTLKDPSLAEELGTDTTHLFAYLLPETYNFHWLNSAETVVRGIKNASDELLRASPESPLGLDLTPDEVLRVASIVEWEAHLVDEKPTIAGVYLNRLRDGWRLQADPTVQYVLLEREGQKRRLLFKDYEIDHPYNTYLFGGLPPGPITNPSPSSIRAVLAPESHGYYFFVARGDGGHIFSRTLREHNRAAANYYRVMRERRRQN